MPWFFFYFYYLLFFLVFFFIFISIYQFNLPRTQSAPSFFFGLVSALERRLIVQIAYTRRDRELIINFPFIYLCILHTLMKLRKLLVYLFQNKAILVFKNFPISPSSEVNIIFP